MDKFKETLIYLDNDNLDAESLVSILLLVSSKLEIDTISQTARNEGKTPKGIRDSNRYRKIEIGKQKFAITGLSNNEMPF